MITTNFLKLQPFQMTVQNLVLVWLVGAAALSLAVPVRMKSDFSRQLQFGRMIGKVKKNTYEKSYKYKLEITIIYLLFYSLHFRR